MCEYCEGKTPLTDKVWDDGTKFDDMQGNSIEYFGKVPMLISYIREKYFSCFKYLTTDHIQLMTSRWAVPINYCPACGKKLSEDEV